MPLGSTAAGSVRTVGAMTDESVADRFRRRAQGLADVVAAVPDDKWASPSPCGEWDARAVLGHVVDTQYMFAGFIGLEPERGPSVDDDPVAAWDVARGHTLAELEDPELAAKEFDGFAGRSTFAAAADRFLAFDLVVHRWDLASAAGLDTTLPAQDVADLEVAAQALSGAMGDQMRARGAFGPVLDPPADADAQTRLLAFLGRKAW